MIIAPMIMPRKAATGGRRYPRWLLASLLSLLLPVITTVAATQSPKDQSADLHRIRTRIEEVRQTLKHDRGLQGRLQRSVQRTEQQLQGAHAALTSITAQLSRENGKLAQARARRLAAAQTLRKQKTALAQQLRAAYMEQSRNRLQMLLSARDPGLVARILDYYAYVARARMKAITSVRQQLAQVSALEQQVKAERSRLIALQQKRQRAVALLQQDQRARTAAVVQLKERIAGKAATLQHLQAARQRIQQLLESVRNALKEEPYAPGNHEPFARLKGHLPWPLHGKILARFDAPEADGRLHWQGIWIAATKGTPVRACARGRVVYVGWLSSYGLIVLLQHGGDYFSLYGHDNSAQVRVGDTVRAGQVIARAGDTGGHDRSGLYLELRQGSRPLDPRKWLAR